MTPRVELVAPFPSFPSFPSYGPEAAAWIEENCVAPYGEWINQPLVLLPWQHRWLNRLYRVDSEGRLVYRWALLGIPKKNGKSTIAAALALYHLLGDPDEPDPWVVCAAGSGEQADLVFGAAKRMAENSPALRDDLRVYRHSIVPVRGPGLIERVASSKGNNDGKNISLLLADELHEWDLENWTILTNGTSGRRRAQIVQITTAGYDLSTVCGIEYAKGRAIERGEIDNPTYLFDWYGADPDDDWRDPAVWAEANPSYGELVFEEVIRDKMINTPESQFRRYYLNQWVEAESMWLPSGLWSELVDRDFKLVEGAPTWAGWDASTKRDSTAVAIAQWAEEPNDPTLPEGPADNAATDPILIALGELDEALAQFLATNKRKLRVQARVWERPLDMNGNPDEDWRLPIGEVEQHVRDLKRKYDLREVAYDPMFITWSATTLEVEGLPMVEFPQTDARMCPATQTAFEMAVRGALLHEGDGVLTRHVRSAALANARNGGQRLAKGRARNPMDAAIAMVMAIYRAVRALLGEQRPPRLWF